MSIFLVYLCIINNAIIHNQNSKQNGTYRTAKTQTQYGGLKTVTELKKLGYIKKTPKKKRQLTPRDRDWETKIN